MAPSNFPRGQQVDLLLIIFIFLLILTGCQSDQAEENFSSYIPYDPGDNRFLMLTFDYPSSWKWDYYDASTPFFIQTFNPKEKPGMDSSGAVFIQVRLYEEDPDVYEFEVNRCLSDLPTPEGAWPEQDLIADRELMIDSYPARWITERREPFYDTELHELVECIAIDAGDRTYAITAHIALEDVGQDFGQGFYHMIDTIDINP